jgi:hypothetical protein
MSVEFRAFWCGTDLGEYRPCASTYELYPDSSIPSLDDAVFTGSYSWFGDPGPTDPVTVSKIADLHRHLSPVNLTLPPDCVTFHTHTLFAQSLEAVSVTACWSDLAEQPLPSPVEPGAFLVRFLRDQQDCVTWYLYLRPASETFVVHSFAEHSYEDDAHDEQIDAEIYWCAPSLEQFA